MVFLFKYLIVFVSLVIISEIKGNKELNEEMKKEIQEAGCPFKTTNQLMVQNICLMPNYHSNEPPNGIYTRTTIFIQLHGAFMLEVDEKNNKFTIQISENLQWLEPRMRTNFSKVPKDVNMIKLSEDSFSKIWHPEKDMHTLNILKQNTLYEPKFYKDLVVIKDEETSQNASLVDAWKDWTATIFCPFDFSSFPFDTQRCEFSQKADRHTKTLLVYYFPEENTKLSYDAVGFHINIELSGPFVDINESLWNVEKGTEEIGFTISMKRVFKPYLYKYYLPCIIIVAVSQISYIIPLSAIPGRVGLVATQFLTLVNIFIHQLAESPSGANLNSLGVYLLVSLFFVIAAMFEFAAVLMLKRRRIHKLDTISNQIKSPNNIIKSGSSEIFKIKPKENNLELDPLNDVRKLSFKTRFKDVTDKIDFIAFMSFVICYLLFNMFYIAMYA